MESKEYRLTHTPVGRPHMAKAMWHVHVTHGLCDVQYVGSAEKQSEARALAKAHAAQRSIKPIILT